MHKPKMTYIDNPTAPDIFADGFAGVQTAHGLVRITLASWRHDYSKVALLPDKVFDGADLNCVCIGRLVMTPAAAKLMAQAVLDLLNAAAVLMPEADQGAPPSAPGSTH
jgi:hypothetical protein